MFTLGFIVEYEGILADNDPQRLVNRITKQVNHDILEYWHRVILPRHFRRGAENRYGYQMRSPKTAIIKRQQFQSGKAISPDRPLVRGGELQNRLKSLIIIRAFPTRAVGQMYGPYYAGMRPFRPGLPNYGVEITEVSDEEQGEIGSIATMRTAELFRQGRTRKRSTRIK